MSAAAQSESMKPPAPREVTEIRSSGSELPQRRATEFPPCRCGSPSCPTVTGEPETLR